MNAAQSTKNASGGTRVMLLLAAHRSGNPDALQRQNGTLTALGARLFRIPGQRPTQIRQPVEITKDLEVWIFQCENVPFRPAANGPGEIERSGTLIATRNNPVLRI